MNELTRVMQQQASDSKQSFVPLWSITNYTKSASAEKQQLQQMTLNEKVSVYYAKNSELMNSVAYRVIYFKILLNEVKVKFNTCTITPLKHLKMHTF